MPVLGYLLNMDNGYGGSYTTIYNGLNYPNVFSYTQTGLTTGLTYSFTLQALNYNGASTASTAVSFIACIVPYGFSSPLLSAVSITSMTLTWTAPSSNGGCQITSYHIFMDDGAGGAYTEVSPATVNSIPSLRSYTISTFAITDTSKTYRFYMVSDNIVGSITSSVVSYVLAAVPDQPTTVPTLDLTGTTAF